MWPAAGIDTASCIRLFSVIGKIQRLTAKKRGCEEMNPHFFTAPFYFAFIWFKVQGSGFRVQVSRFRGSEVQRSRGGFAAFFRSWYSRIAAFPVRGRCPKGADRVTMA
ncbi:MAG: hypothetical protein EGR19_05685 [Dialister sp.]|nr:hypothetical protein [Dialister sp.]